MLKTSFYANYNGKLFADVFNTVRLADPDKYKPGTEHEIWLKSTFLGTAEVMSVRFFRFHEIRDILSFLEVGGASYKLSALLKQWYPQVQFDRDTALCHVCYKYTKRNMGMQRFLIHEWWKELESNVQEEEAMQLTLGL